MQAALEEAKAAAARDEVPVGAVLVHAKTGEIAAKAGNRSVELSDPSAHAEMLVIRDLCTQLGQQRLPEYDLYVTLEPCTMCAGVISFARIRKLYFGTYDVKGGAVAKGVKFFNQPTCHHRPEVEGPIMENSCGQILKDYFRGKRLRAET